MMIQSRHRAVLCSSRVLLAIAVIACGRVALAQAMNGEARTLDSVLRAAARGELVPARSFLASSEATQAELTMELRASSVAVLTGLEPMLALPESDELANIRSALQALLVCAPRESHRKVPNDVRQVFSQNGIASRLQSIASLFESHGDVAVAEVLSIRATSSDVNKSVEATIWLGRAAPKDALGPMCAILDGVGRLRLARLAPWIRTNGSARLRPWAAQILVMAATRRGDHATAKSQLGNYLAKHAAVMARSPAYFHLANSEHYLRASIQDVIDTQGPRLWYWDAGVKFSDCPAALLSIEWSRASAVSALRMDRSNPRVAQQLAYVLAVRQSVLQALSMVADAAQRAWIGRDLRAGAADLQLLAGTAVDRALERALKEQNHVISRIILAHLPLCGELPAIEKGTGLDRALRYPSANVRAMAVRSLRRIAEGSTRLAYDARVRLTDLGRSADVVTRELAQIELTLLTE